MGRFVRKGDYVYRNYRSLSSIQTLPSITFLFISPFLHFPFTWLGKWRVSDKVKEEWRLGELLFIHHSLPLLLAFSLVGELVNRKDEIEMEVIDDRDKRESSFPIFVSHLTSSPSLAGDWMRGDVR